MQDLIRQWGGVAVGFVVLAAIAVRLCLPGEKRSGGADNDGGSWFGPGDEGHHDGGDSGGHH